MRRLLAWWVSHPHPVRLAIGLWLLLLVAVTGRVAVSRPASQSVVPIYRAAGERWLRSADLYTVTPGMDLYRNPPGTAAAFVPLAVLPEKVGAVGWRLGSAAVLLLGLARFRRAVAPDLSPAAAGWLFVAAAVLSLPSVNNGQVNVLLAGAGLNAAAAFARRRWWEAAAWLGVGFGLKLYPLAVGLLFVVAAPRPLGPRLAAVVLAVAVAPFLLQDTGYVLDQHRGFLAQLGSDDRTHAGLERVPRDWTVLPRVWLGVVPTAAVAKAVALLAGGLMAAGVGLAGRAGAGLRAAAGRTLALGSVWMTLFGPATEPATYAVLAGVAGWLAARPVGSRFARLPALAGCSLLAVTVARGAFPDDWRFNALGPQPLGTLLLLLSLVVEGVAGWAAVRRGDGVAKSFAARVRVGSADVRSAMLPRTERRSERAQW